MKRCAALFLATVELRVKWRCCICGGDIARWGVIVRRSDVGGSCGGDICSWSWRDVSRGCKIRWWIMMNICADNRGCQFSDRRDDWCVGDVRRDDGSCRSYNRSMAHERSWSHHRRCVMNGRGDCRRVILGLSQHIAVIRSVGLVSVSQSEGTLRLGSVFAIASAQNTCDTHQCQDLERAENNFQELHASENGKLTKTFMAERVTFNAAPLETSRDFKNWMMVDSRSLLLLYCNCKATFWQRAERGFDTRPSKRVEKLLQLVDTQSSRSHLMGKLCVKMLNCGNKDSIFQTARAESQIALFDVCRIWPRWTNCLEFKRFG